MCESMPKALCLWIEISFYKINFMTDLPETLIKNSLFFLRKLVLRHPVARCTYFWGLFVVSSSLQAYVKRLCGLSKFHR